MASRFQEAASQPAVLIPRTAAPGSPGSGSFPRTQASPRPGCWSPIGQPVEVVEEGVPWEEPLQEPDTGRGSEPGGDGGQEVSECEGALIPVRCGGASPVSSVQSLPAHPLLGPRNLAGCCNSTLHLPLSPTSPAPQGPIPWAKRSGRTLASEQAFISHFQRDRRVTGVASSEQGKGNGTVRLGALGRM